MALALQHPHIMKTISLLPCVAATLLFGLIGAPTTADAKPKDKGRNYSHSTSDRDRDRDRDRRRYLSIPRSSFTLTLGTGYAGRGYYYGPPGMPYYYERPDVRYYRHSHQVPRSYYGESYHGGSGRTAAAVQRALARRGFYYGPVDGDIGPGSRRAIARYQSAHRLPVTGTIDRSLLRSLGLG